MKYLKYIKKILTTCIYAIYGMIYRFIPTDDHLVIFISFHGRGYSDNPRAIYEYMKSQERFKDYRFIWFIKKQNQKNINIPGAQIKTHQSLSYFYYLSKAKYWIINIKMPEFIKKKEDQIYLQTWHGTPLKRLGKDIQVGKDSTFYRTQMTYEEMIHSYDDDVAKYTYMISPNHFCTEVFQSAFGINKERLIETGYPRNDYMTNISSKEITDIKNKLHIPLNKKVILYAPTWRDNSYNMSGYTFELKADFHLWKEIFGNDYVLLFKPHYTIVNKYKEDTSLNGFLYSISAEAEINELYVISDALITDYSSVFFDYAILNRPIYFYMYDLKEYAEQLRGFYLDIYKDLPGQIYENEEKMLKDIKDNVYNYDKLNDFNKRFNHAQTGDCAKKVVDIVFKD